MFCAGGTGGERGAEGARISDSGGGNGGNELSNALGEARAGESAVDGRAWLTDTVLECVACVRRGEDVFGAVEAEGARRGTYRNVDDLRAENAGLSIVEGPASAVREDCPVVPFEMADVPA